MQIVWTFPQFIVTPFQDGFQNVIIGVNWVCTGSDNGVTSSASGSVMLGTPNPAEFISYDQITYPMVYGWVSGRIDMQSIEQQVVNQLTVLSTPAAQSQKSNLKP